MPLYLSRREAADFLSSEGFKTAQSTLVKLASTGGGPLFSKYGRKPVYTHEDLLRWAQGRTSEPRASTTRVTVSPETA